LIVGNIALAGDFNMADLDADGNWDWIPNSRLSGQRFIVVQIQPDSGLIATILFPDILPGEIT
jgi:hypothetical protein